MNPPKPTTPAALPVTRPAPLAHAPAVPPNAASAGVPLGMAASIIGAGALLVAGATGYAAATFAPAVPWAAALGAAVGVVAAGLPMGWLVWRLAHEAAPAGGRGGSGAAPAAGVSRELFFNLAEREFARARRYGTGAALLLVDVDRWARLCEARGVPAGEAVMAELLKQTAPTLRTADVLTQISGAQMAVFLAHADATGALDVAERIRERTEQMEVALDATQPPQRLRVTASAGVAHLRPAHMSLAALIDDAQDAVAAARQAGGNCVRAAPVDSIGMPGIQGSWRERRARPKQGGAS